MKRLLPLIALLFIGCPPPQQPAAPVSSSPPQVENIDYIARLNSATKIEIQEYALSVGKDYDVVADGVKVATVSGKDIRFLEGDIFTLKDLNGAVLASEEEELRFLLEFNRTAVVYDDEGAVSGYLAEDRISNLFSLSYVFYFYDKDRKVVGKSAKFTNSCLGTHKIYDAEDKEIYDVRKHLTLIGGDTYTITVVDSESPVSRYQAILLVCIEDAIGDAAAAKKDD